MVTDATDSYGQWLRLSIRKTSISAGSWGAERRGVRFRFGVGTVQGMVSHPQRRSNDETPVRQAALGRCPIAAMPPGFPAEVPGTGRHQRDSRFAKDIERLAVKQASRLKFLPRSTWQFDSPWGRKNNLTELLRKLRAARPLPQPLPHPCHERGRAACRPRRWARGASTASSSQSSCAPGTPGPDEAGRQRLQVAKQSYAACRAIGCAEGLRDGTRLRCVREAAKA